MSKSKIWRILWMLVIATAFGVLVFQIYMLWNKYSSYPISTRVEVRNSPLAYPSVTICNKNPYRKSAVLHSGDPGIENLKDAFLAFTKWKDATAAHNLEARTDEPKDGVDESKGLRKAANSVEPTNRTETATRLSNTNTNKPIEIPPSKEMRVSVHRLRLESLRVPKSVTKKYSHQALSLILSCRFLGNICSYKNFTRYVTPKYGNCYTFNTNKMRDSPMVINRRGATNGLTLILNAEVYEYLPLLSTGTGVNLLIHEFGTFPYPMGNSYEILTGHHTSVGVTVRKLTRLGKPYGKCSPRKSVTPIPGGIYNTQACQSKCIHERIEKDCDCNIYHQTDEKNFLPKSKKRKCTTDRDVRCSLQIPRQYRRQMFNCKCPQPCNETLYACTSSMSLWPSKGYINILAERQCRWERMLIKQGVRKTVSICEKLKSKNAREFAAANLIAMTIYFKHLNYESIVQEAAYPIESFLSDIGGTMGLYAGISLLTGVEVFALLCTLIRALIKSRKVHVNGKDNEDDV